VIRPTWDEYFGQMAELVSTRAACTRRQVGAVVVDSETHSMLGTGYNGTVRGELNCSDGGCPRGLLSKSDLAPGSDYNGKSPCNGMHAEHNAILDAGLDRSKNATLYINGHNPCSQCSVLIKAVGIARVVVI
jgi:dCMP deaminase